MVSIEIEIFSKLITVEMMNIYLIKAKCVYTRKFIIGTSLIVGISIHLHKRIKTRYWESYLNILDSFLLAYPLYLLVEYLTAKAKRQEKAHVLFYLHNSGGSEETIMPFVVPSL